VVRRFNKDKERGKVGDTVEGVSGAKKGTGKVPGGHPKSNNKMSTRKKGKEKKERVKNRYLGGSET